MGRVEKGNEGCLNICWTLVVDGISLIQDNLLFLQPFKAADFSNPQYSVRWSVVIRSRGWTESIQRDYMSITVLCVLGALLLIFNGKKSVIMNSVYSVLGDKLFDMNQKRGMKMKN